MQRRTFAIAGAAALAAPMVRAQTLPNGPIRIIVGFAPGGGTDILSRVIGQKTLETGAFRLPLTLHREHIE